MKKVIKIMGMTGILTLLRMLTGFVITKAVAVYTGPSGLALLGQVQGMVAVLGGVLNSPATSGVVRYTAENKGGGYDACAPWWKASVQWILVLSSIVIPITILLSDYIADLILKDKSLSWVITLAVCFLPLSAFGTLCNSVINGQQNYRRYIGLGLTSIIVSASMIIGMIVYGNIKGALVAAALQSSLIGLVMVVGNLRQPWFSLSFLWGNVDPQARKNIRGYMLMAMTTALTVPVSIICVRSILVEYVGWESTGHWQAVWKVSEVYLSVITLALSTYYLPRLSSLVGVDAIVLEIKKTATLIVPAIVLMAVIVFLAKDLVIELLFTPEFYSARELFLLHLSGDVIKISGFLYAYPMISRGATKWYITSEVFFSCSLVILTYFFVSNLGIKGANLAYLCNYTLYFCFVFFNVRRFSK